MVVSVVGIESNNRDQPEDLKLGIGLTVGALSLATIFALGIASMPKNEKVSVNPTTQTETTEEGENLGPLGKELYKTAEDTSPAEFNNSSRFEKVTNFAALGGQIYFTGETPSIVTDDAKFVDYKSRVKSKNLYVPDSVYRLNDKNTIINQGNETFFYNNLSGDSQKLPKNISNLTKIGNKYLFLDTASERITVKVSNSLDLRIAESGLSFTKSEIGNPDFVKVKIINQIPYLVLSKVTKEGLENITIYNIGETSLNKKFEIANVYSQKNSNNKMLFSVSENRKSINTTLVDFTNPENITSSVLDFQGNLGKRGVTKITAQRCAFSNDEKTLVCLMKQGQASYSSESKKDLFLNYNIQTQKAEFINKDIKVSGKSVYYSPSGQLHIVGQEKGIVYKIKDK